MEAEPSAVENRFDRLVQVAEAVVGQLSLTAVLREIVEAACEIADAPFGALGVLSPTGDGLEEFIHVGIDEEEAATIGHLPHGLGLLGALIDDPVTIRLDDLTRDPRSVGFPAHHPPMRGFLGVPVVVRGAIFGNLYLATLGGHTFTDEDEHLVEALAGLAGVAIANARLYDEAARRQRWLEASTAFSQELLTTGQDPVVRLGEIVQQLADADTVTIVSVLTDDQLEVVIASGNGADKLRGLRYGREHSYVDQVLRTTQPVIIRDAEDRGEIGDHFVHLSQALAVGPLMVLPLMGPSGARGALSVGRSRGRPPFDRADSDMAATFAGHAAVALELAEARRAREGAALLEDRARIARDLHDHVIQQLFGAGLTLQGIAAGAGPEAALAMDDVIERLDDSIRQIRTAIFGLRPQSAVSGSLRESVLATAREAARALGFAPDVRFEGPVDVLADADLVRDVVAVVREALSNVARHARATRAQVVVAAEAGHLDVRVDDDGTGVIGSHRGSGLANLEVRAHARGGAFLFEPGDTGGTSLRWSARF